MRILHSVGFYEPHKGGSEEVVRQLSERLAKKGNDVVVATSHDQRRTWSQLNGVEVRSFRISGNHAIGIRGETAPYIDFLQTSKFDVMMNYAAQIWSTDLVLPLLGRINARKVFMPIGYSGLGSSQYEEYFRKLPEYLRDYDVLVYNSANYRDKWFGDEVGLGDKAVILPNGAAEEEFDADTPHFRERFGIRTSFMVVTVSNHHTIKGHKRLIRSLRSLHRSDATLVIIGEPAVPPRPWIGCYPYCRAISLIDKDVRVLTGIDRELVVSAFKEADVFVLASDVECSPLVIYEAMAAGSPFVATDCGNVRDNADFGIVVDDPSQIGSAIAMLLDDRDRRMKLGADGKEAWKKAYTWDAIVDQYENLYRRLVETR